MDGRAPVASVLRRSRVLLCLHVLEKEQLCVCQLEFHGYHVNSPPLPAESQGILLMWAAGF